MYKRILVALAFIALFSRCGEKCENAYIMTVTGAVAVENFGQCLCHEHVMVDWAGAVATGSHRWNADSVVNRVLPYLLEIKALGINSFVDCSPAYLGRDPYILRALSEKSGLNIVSNTGYYGAVNNRYMPYNAYEESAEEIAKHWIYEFENGIDGSGIKPGFIKISVKEDTLLSDLHKKIVTAAAITHKATGLVIKSHTGGNVPAFDQLNLLKLLGVSPSAFIWTHAQGGSLEKNIEAARLGAWVSLDGVNISNAPHLGNSGNMEEYIERLTEFKNEGLLNRVLISHDAGQYNVGQPNGGYFRAYTDISKLLVPELLNRGFTPADIQLLLVQNPVSAFKICKIRE